ncbi:MAG: patatin family protein [Bacteroidaceae bacterium]|nr:patatin family protein [Bacteroidaceae bacterium]
MKNGLVLEGGAMRGMFSAGVMDVMMEHGIGFDGIVGVSAGAAFGCNYKSRQIGRALRYNQLMAKDKRYCSVGSLLKTGNLFNADFAYHYVPTKIDIFDCETYDNNPMEYHVVCTDVTTGNAVYKILDHIDYNGLEWIRASASMPLCSKIVDLEGYKLLDGGVADSIPLEYFERQGYERNIVILTQPAGFCKKPTPLMSLMRIGLRKYPNMVRALRDRHIMYNKQLEYVAQAEREKRALVIRPPFPLPIGHICHDPEEMQRVYDIGRETGMKEMEAIVNFMEH